MKKTFRRATLRNGNGFFEISACYSFNAVRRLEFMFLIVEWIVDGRCESSIAFHPWQYRFNHFRMMKAARKACYGKKTNHVKN